MEVFERSVMDTDGDHHRIFATVWTSGANSTK
jgi:hypothetical protein